MKVKNRRMMLYLFTIFAGLSSAQEKNADELLQQELQKRYSEVLKQAQIDRQNDPNLYHKRLETIDGYLQQSPMYHNGIGGGVSSAIGDRLTGIARDTLHQPEAVPFLLDVVINGPPTQTKGIWKMTEAKSIYSYQWKPGEYELWARCIAAGILGRYKHPDVLPILAEYLKKASQAELKIYSAYGLRLSMDPNAIELLINALSDSNQEVRGAVWAHINKMTGRGSTLGQVPNSDEIAEFKDWWQRNKHRVTTNLVKYNRPNRYTSRADEEEARLIREMVEKSGLSMSDVRVVDISKEGLSIVWTNEQPDIGDPNVEWCFIYRSPTGKTTEVIAKPWRNHVDILSVPQLGGEFVLTTRTQDREEAWAYVGHVKKRNLILPQDGDFVAEMDKRVDVVLKCQDKAMFSSYPVLCLHQTETAKLSLYQLSIKNDTEWPLSVSVMPGTYYVYAEHVSEDKRILLDTITVQPDVENVFKLELIRVRVPGKNQ